MQSVPKNFYAVEEKASNCYIHLKGTWDITTLPHIIKTFTPLAVHIKHITWDVDQLDSFDSSAVAWIEQQSRQWILQGLKVSFTDKNADFLRLHSILYPSHTHTKVLPSAPKSWLYQLGYRTVHMAQSFKEILHYIGELFLSFFYFIRHPSGVRYHSIIFHIYQSGLSALPIIGMSAFLIGVVIAYQSIVQLQKFGADIFIVDTIGISLSRELAPLITAIIVAGRSGSAYTAQIGAMKMTQEIDAMRTMAFHPYLYLAWPRIIALMITLPLLIFFADIMGYAGGMVIANIYSHLSFNEFIHRLQSVLALKHLMIGIIKGPFFALLIASVSVYRGFQVSMNTESIGKHTTMSVVNSIFLVIMCDAVFSIILTELRI